MTNAEMVLDVAKRIMEMEAENEALHRILDRSWPLANDPWPQFVEKGKQQILALETSRLRSDEFQRVSESQTDPTTLIRVLYSEVLGRQSVS